MAAVIRVAAPRGALDTALADALAKGLHGTLRWLAEATAVEVATGLDRAAAAARTAAIAGGEPVDVAVLDAASGVKRLLLSDMDSTMITVECIDELADHLGIKPEIAAITRRTMNGELDFVRSVQERVALLAGLEEAVIGEICRERVRASPGAAMLLATMRARGAHTVLVSGGFTPFTRHVRAMLGFDVDEANELEVRDGRLTGRLVPPIRDASAKVEALERHATARGLDADDVVALGDGANDIPMLRRAGLGIAWRAHPSVRAAVPVRIDHGDLVSALWFQGLHEAELVRA